MSANPGIATRLREWSIEREPLLMRKKWYGPGEPPAWYKALSPGGVLHRVCVRSGHSFCLHHGESCEATSAVLSRLLARELTLLPSRQEIEEKAKGKRIEVGYHLTDIGREAMNAAPDAWCSWCDYALAPSDATIVHGHRVHKSCAPEAVSDREDLK